LTIYKDFSPISCATRISTRFYLKFDSNAGFVEIREEIWFWSSLGKLSTQILYSLEDGEQGRVGCAPGLARLRARGKHAGESGPRGK
jgi:hypothetical protein